MAAQKGLAIIRVDGLGYDDLIKGLAQGRMPFFSSLLASAGYQVGGHGCLGGAQQAPFIMTKREYESDTSSVADASELYPQLRLLCNRLVRG